VAALTESQLVLAVVFSFFSFFAIHVQDRWYRLITREREINRGVGRGKSRPGLAQEIFSRRILNGFYILWVGAPNVKEKERTPNADDDEDDERRWGQRRCAEGKI